MFNERHYYHCSLTNLIANLSQQLSSKNGSLWIPLTCFWCLNWAPDSHNEWFASNCDLLHAFSSAKWTGLVRRWIHMRVMKLVASNGHLQCLFRAVVSFRPSNRIINKRVQGRVFIARKHLLSVYLAAPNSNGSVPTTQILWPTGVLLLLLLWQIYKQQATSLYSVAHLNKSRGEFNWFCSLSGLIVCLCAQVEFLLLISLLHLSKLNKSFNLNLVHCYQICHFSLLLLSSFDCRI